MSRDPFLIPRFLVWFFTVIFTTEEPLLSIQITLLPLFSSRWTLHVNGFTDISSHLCRPPRHFCLFILPCLLPLPIPPSIPWSWVNSGSLKKTTQPSPARSLACKLHAFSTIQSRLSRTFWCLSPPTTVTFLCSMV